MSTNPPSRLLLFSLTTTRNLRSPFLPVLANLMTNDIIGFYFTIFCFVSQAVFTFYSFGRELYFQVCQALLLRQFLHLLVLNVLHPGLTVHYRQKRQW